MKLKIGEWLKKYIDKTLLPDDESTMQFPPNIAKTLGFDLVDIGEATASIVIITNPEVHANPMGTIHGGVLCDIADTAIGTAHATTLAEGESFTSVDLQINFFRPVWRETLIAKARPINLGKTISRYVCDITREDGKLIAQVTSTVMTLKDTKAQGR